MTITFEHSEPQTPHVTTFYFKTPQSFMYTAGQFIELTIDHPRPDNRGKNRWFTLSSSPNDDLLSITTRIASEQLSTFKQALVNLKAGDTLLMSDPMGDFVLPKLVQIPLIFVAGGIGITPFLSIFKTMTYNKEQRDIKMLWAVEREQDIAFQDVLDAANQHATIIVNKPSATWGGLRGLVSPQEIIGLEQPTPDSLIYISGPEQMVETLASGLIKLGFKKSQIVGDYFPGY